MKNVEPGPNFTTDANDYTLLSFADELNTVIFGGEVPYTQANCNLSHEHGNPVDESSIEKVSEYIEELGLQKRVTEREKMWAASWKKPKLLTALPAKDVLAQKVQEAKLFGASDAFKNWFEETMLHEFADLFLTMSISNSQRIACILER